MPSVEAARGEACLCQEYSLQFQALHLEALHLEALTVTCCADRETGLSIAETAVFFIIILSSIANSRRIRGAIEMHDVAANSTNQRHRGKRLCIKRNPW